MNFEQILSITAFRRRPINVILRLSWSLTFIVTCSAGGTESERLEMVTRTIKTGCDFSAEIQAIDSGFLIATGESPKHAANLTFGESMENAICAALLLVSVACVTQPSKQGAAIIESDDKGVASCRFVGNVEGSSTFGGMSASDLQQSSKAEARDKAAGLGASHVVWMSANQNMDNASVMGRAYACAK